MKIEKLFPHLLRLVEFGDKISKGSKTGANISIGEGGVILTNDMHSIVVLMEHSEFTEEMAFKSHLFPEALSPLDMEALDKSIDFGWKLKSTKKSVNVPSCGNLYVKGVEAVEKMWKMKNTFMLPAKAFNQIDDDIHVLKVIRNEDGVTFEQSTTTGDEIFKTEIPLKQGGGLLSHVDESEVEEVETIVPTIEFKSLPILTDESVLKLSIPKDNGAIFAQILMGSINVKVIVTPMKYKR